MTKREQLYLTDAERDIYLGIKSARAKKMQENMIKTAVGVALGIEKTKYLDTGEKVVVTVAEELAAKTIKDALENPSTSKLKDLSAIMGENKITVEHQSEKGMDIFLGIRAGSDIEGLVVKREDDTETRQST